jgi:hypothetical protein
MENERFRGKIMLDTATPWTELEPLSEPKAKNALERLEIAAGNNLPLIAPFY